MSALRKTPRQLSPAEALARLEDLCSRSEQSSGEIRARLARWNISARATEEIMKELIGRRFVDDRRFATAFARDKLRFSGWGRRKIMLHLYKKRVDREIISEALEALDQQEYELTARRILLQKAATLDDADSYEGRTKLYRFAASRGFETDLIAAILRRKRLPE